MPPAERTQDRSAGIILNRECSPPMEDGMAETGSTTLIVTGVKRNGDEFELVIEVRGPVLGTKELGMKVEASSYAEAFRLAKDRLREFAQQIVESVDRDASPFR
jgi:hypothetical protein